MEGSGRHCCLSSGPTLHEAVCVYPELMYSKKSLLCGPSESGMKAISGIRQLCLRQCFNILYAPAPIWCVTFPPWRAHHAYYCLLFWETPRRAVCRVKCKGFTERLCPPGPATQQLWLIKRILSVQGEKKKKNLFTAPSRLSAHNSCPVPEAQTSNFQMPTQSGVIATISPAKNVRWMVIFCFMISQEWWPYSVREILCPSLISGA